MRLGGPESIDEEIRKGGCVCAHGWIRGVPRGADRNELSIRQRDGELNERLFSIF